LNAPLKKGDKKENVLGCLEKTPSTRFYRRRTLTWGGAFTLCKRWIHFFLRGHVIIYCNMENILNRRSFLKESAGILAALTVSSTLPKAPRAGERPHIAVVEGEKPSDVYIDILKPWNESDVISRASTGEPIAHDPVWSRPTAIHSSWRGSTLRMSLLPGCFGS